MTPAQRIAIKQRDLGNADRSRALAQVRVILGRSVETRADVSEAEVPVLMLELERRRRDGLAVELAGAGTEYLVRRLLEMAGRDRERQAVAEEIAIRLFADRIGDDDAEEDGD